eukprot:TRINITY_DN7878_c0_g1_i3.p1 TRINITY_DN7878_c0_g1~~TRINITY_DN7878_c0_g1_i3.p1  ORF type:complete len:1000 (-),score=242.76 TRINITY_DN7878_c0_g1_i3:139-3138(-)
MIARLRVRSELRFISQTVRGIRTFEGRKRSRLRKYLVDAHIDFTNTQPAQQYLKVLKAKVKAASGFVPLSETVNQTKVPKVLPIYVELKREQRRSLSMIFRKRATRAISAISNANLKNLEEKILYLDKTAAVLENYRRILEVKIFNRLLHREREKKLFLRMHSRKLENLIPDFDIRFKTFERWNNTGLAINEPQYTIKSFLDEPKTSGRVNDGYQKYTKDQNTLANIRIEQFLTDRPRNPKLLQLASGAESDETSVVAKAAMPPGVVVSSESEYQVELKHQVQLASNIASYEKSVIKYYDDTYDIYKVHRGRGRPNFLTLTKEQLLNYIKFDIKGTNDLFEIYNEIKEHKDTLTVAASLLQKLAISIDKKDMNRLIACKPFMQIFHDARRAKAELTDKELVDTLFGVSLIYSNVKSSELMPKYLWHFTCDYVGEIERRISSLNENHLAFTCKALKKLQGVYEFFPEVTDLNIKILSRLGQCVPKMYSYNIAPVIDYIAENNLYATSKELVKLLVGRLVEVVVSGKENYVQPKDLVKCASAIANFPERSDWGRACLEKLKDVALTELGDFSFANSSSLLKAYSTTKQWHADLFDKVYGHACKIYQLQAEPVDFGKYSNMLWSVSGYFTHKGFQALNLELGAFMCPSTEYKLGQYKARLLDSLMTYVDRFEFTVGNAHWWAKIVYAMGILNYKNHKDITEKAAELLCANTEAVTVSDWGYFLQGLMMLQCVTKDIFTTAIESISTNGVKAKLHEILRCYLALAQAGLLPDLVKADTNFAKGLSHVYQHAKELLPDQIAALLWCMIGIEDMSKKVVEEIANLVDTSKVHGHMCALLSQALSEVSGVPHILTRSNAKAFEYERKYLDQCLENMEAKCGKNLEKELVRVLKSDAPYYNSMKFIEGGRINSYLLPILSEKKKLCVLFEFDNDILMETNTGNFPTTPIAYFTEKWKQLEKAGYKAIKLNAHSFAKWIHEYTREELLAALRATFEDKKVRLRAPSNA